MVSNTLKWIDHVNYIIKKANKRLYFLVLPRRAKVPPDDILKFYCTCMRPVLEYSAPVFHNSLPGYLSNEMNAFKNERYQSSLLGHFTPTVLRLITLIPWQKDVRNYSGRLRHGSAFEKYPPRCREPMCVDLAWMVRGFCV